MDKRKRTHISKFLSLVLRHQPGEIGLELDRGGWAGIDDLIARARRADVDVDRSALHEVLEKSPKKRFEFSPDGEKIRARYGHSIDVDLQYEAQEPPPTLYHGTARRFVEDIKQEGLLPQGRNMVHLSASPGAGQQVGARHGKAVILRVDAERMADEGYSFYPSTDMVWLVKKVPPQYLGFPEG